MKLVFSFLAAIAFFLPKLSANCHECSPCPMHSCCHPIYPCWYDDLYLHLSAGYGWSTQADISVNTAFWDPSPEGYNDDLEQSEFYTVGLGLHLNYLISILIDYTYRPQYHYEKFQTSTASGTPGFLGNKTRYFRLSSNAILANVGINKKGDFWGLHICNCICFAPFIEGGFGIAYNCLYDFHSLAEPATGTTSPRAASIMTQWVETSFAAQVKVGLITKITPRVNLEFGYRRFYGGNIASNNYIVDILPGLTAPQQAPRWNGCLNANEIYLGFNYNL